MPFLQAYTNVANGSTYSHPIEAKQFPFFHSYFRCFHLVYYRLFNRHFAPLFSRHHFDAWSLFNWSVKIVLPFIRNGSKRRGKFRIKLTNMNTVEYFLYFLHSFFASFADWKQHLCNECEKKKLFFWVFPFHISDDVEFPLHTCHVQMTTSTLLRLLLHLPHFSSFRFNFVKWCLLMITVESHTQSRSHQMTR